MAWVEILPLFESLFRRHGMESAASFLGWTGILVNHHRHRQVEQVSLGEPSRVSGRFDAPSDCVPQTGSSRSTARQFFLKKQSAVTWRERFRNAWAGFGWCSTAVREGATLQALRRAGVACPEVAALGEDGKHAFVLLREEAGLSDLRALLQELGCETERCRLAAALGRELARLHDAGFDHPDLFAKHILAGPADGTFRFCILDWQRSRYRRQVSWRIRGRDLAVLDATLLELLASDRLRLRCLRSYWRATHSPDKPPLGRLARQIRVQAERLRGKRRIRDVGQMPTPAGDQAFVPLRGGEVLIVRSFAERLQARWPEFWVSMTEDAAHVWDLLSAFACAAGSKIVRLQTGTGAATDGPMPALAHMLFRLQRYGVLAPRLLAVGGGHALLESRPAIPFAEAFAKASLAGRRRLLQRAGAMVRRIHEAGYHLPPGNRWKRRLGVAPATEEVLLMNVEPMVRGNIPWQQLAPIEFNDPELRLTRTEQLRFLGGYREKSHVAVFSRKRTAARQVAA
jgi:tRNA A-37 threonylcarbamoyl transferase component Bud32